ncbi:MAG: hypothetical protein ABJL99_18300 [Aliishimia sp.]
MDVVGRSLLTLGVLTGAAQAATLTMTLEDRSSLRATPATTLTLNFGNSTDNATTFGTTDFVSREFANLETFGVANLVSNHSWFPVTNLDGSMVVITGTVTSSGTFNFGFNYTEIGMSFTVFDFDWVLANRLNGQALWTNVPGPTGFIPNFYVDGFEYDATGTAADFLMPSAPVPLPAGIPLALSAFGVFAWLRRQQG